MDTNNCHSEQSEEYLEQREYLYDEHEIQQEIDRLQQQYEIYMEQAI